MVKKSTFLWFDKKILVLLIAFYVQNVTSFWGKRIFFKEIHSFFEKSQLSTNTLTINYMRFIKSENIQLHNKVLKDFPDFNQKCDYFGKQK